LEKKVKKKSEKRKNLIQFSQLKMEEKQKNLSFSYSLFFYCSTSDSIMKLQDSQDCLKTEDERRGKEIPFHFLEVKKGKKLRITETFCL
jgi:hypothetical protein